MKTHRVLDEKGLSVDAGSLAAMDQDMARILDKLGCPPLWAREPGFSTLLKIILEQQVSLSSAAVMYERLEEQVKPLTHATILEAGAPFLRSFGITRQKASYFINLSEAISRGDLTLDDLCRFEDEVVIEKLTSIRGIGPWTAKIYLLMALRRPDVWPAGDIALATAYKNLKGLDTRPGQLQLEEIACAWSPYRATAARMLWHYYLNGM